MQLNNKYLEVELLIVDEILMVLNNLLFQIYKSLNDIFIPTQDIPFDGKSVLLWVELYQLQPVWAKPEFIFNETGTTEGFIS